MNNPHSSTRVMTRGASRAMLAAIFVTGGLRTARHPDAEVAAARTVTAPLTRALPAIPPDQTLVRLNAITMVSAGVALALGIVPRAAALVLAGTLLPTTLAGHRFWAEADPDTRTRERNAFLSNVGLAGGLLAVAASQANRATS
ncbi:MAG TPA: DoxX family protein [Trebonia sp.]